MQLCMLRSSQSRSFSLCIHSDAINYAASILWCHNAIMLLCHPLYHLLWSHIDRNRQTQHFNQQQACSVAQQSVLGCKLECGRHRPELSFNRNHRFIDSKQRRRNRPMSWCRQPRENETSVWTRKVFFCCRTYRQIWEKVACRLSSDILLVFRAEKRLQINAKVNTP